MLVPTPLISLLKRLALASADISISDVFPGRVDKKPVVAFVGFQKQGKSSLINALLGVDLLPADSLPATATVCSVSDSKVPQASILVDGSWRPIDFDSRAQYIDQNLLVGGEAPEAVRLGYSAPLLAHMTIVDTAGLGSAEVGHSDSARRGLADADMLMIICSLHRPLGSDDLEILSWLRDAEIPVACVITKTDQADPDDAEGEIQNVTDFVNNVFAQYQIIPLAVFAVSVRDDRLPESPTHGTLPKITTFLEAAVVSSRVQCIFSETRAFLDSRLSECETMHAALLKERFAELDALAKFKRERIALDGEAAKMYASINNSIAAFGESLRIDRTHDEAMLMACVPASSAVNDPDHIPGAWNRFRASAPAQMELVRQRMLRLLREEILVADEILPLGKSGLTHLLKEVDDLPHFRCDLTNFVPANIACKPGFMAVSFGLHGEHIRGQFIDALLSTFREAQSAFRPMFDFIVDRIGVAHTAAFMEHFEGARQRLDAAELLCTERMAEINHRFEDLAKQERDIKQRGVKARNDQDLHLALVKQLSTPVSQLRAEDILFLHAGVMSTTLAGIVSFLDGSDDDAAMNFAEQWAVDVNIDRDIARLYWIARCRQQSDQSYHSDRITRPMIARDPVGAAYWAANTDEPAYTLIQRLVVLAITGSELPPTVGYAPSEGPLKALEQVAIMALDPHRAANASSNMLETLGAPSSFVLFRERLAARTRDPESTRNLAEFAQDHAELLRSAEVEYDLISRLQAHLAGQRPDPRRISSLQAYLRRERWRAIAV